MEVLSKAAMPQLKHNPSRYCGYRTPFHDEICSERLLFDKLRDSDASVRSWNLMPIARQLPVFGVEKLDLLALDKNAVPWIFEFKRDIAPYGAIAQLQTYASYVTGFEMSEFEHAYASGDARRRNLKRDFLKYFGCELPENATRTVKMVLAAYDFSLPCRRAMDFLEYSQNLKIGRLKIECVWDGKNPPVAEYRWLKLPRATEPPNLAWLKSSPTVYYALSLKMDREGNDLVMDWNDCLNNELLPIPDDWNLEANPPLENQGVFVHVHSLFPEENAEDYDHLPSSEGVLAYGIVCEPPFVLKSRPNEFRFPENRIDRLYNRDLPLRVMRVRWVQARFEDMAATTPATYEFYDSKEIALTRLGSDVNEWKLSLCKDPNEDICPF